MVLSSTFFTIIIAKADVHMSKEQDRLQVIQKIHHAAQLYRHHLVGKKFLYVFDGRYIEVIYKSENFRHLTGVATSLSAKSFYSKAARQMLGANQISFTPVHPYALCLRKLQHIGQIATMAGSESFMLEEITTQTQSYKFGTTDLHFSLCMNKELDDEGKEKGECYVVQSLRDEDCFSKSKDAYVVTHIFAKPNDAKRYAELLYRDESPQGCEVPGTVLDMLDDGLRMKLRPGEGQDDSNKS